MSELHVGNQSNELSSELSSQGNTSPEIAEKVSEIPKSVLEYLKEMGLNLKNDYRTKDGKYIESCSLIAADIAKLLLAENMSPYLMSIRGQKKDDGINRTSLVPKAYDGRVTWGAHVVCCVDGLVLDPMIGEPKTIDEYSRMAFENQAECKIEIPTEKIEEFISR
jgi:hypothetical protein